MIRKHFLKQILYVYIYIYIYILTEASESYALRLIPVRKTSSVHLRDDVQPVIVAKSSRHLLVRHALLALFDAPHLGQTSGIGNAEHHRVAVFPADVVRQRLVHQQLGKKLPE